eukprot:TRINITY_DN6454_c0_g1_i1.p1 TRINITY_DN6454_c0_g1~~TRINITY_DN6454_c0_g1_i1.p1  ORF type:complete len:1644 (+),score=320.75 TRINITY_DN6454_c0_g1_i1:84-5015(+)
MARGRRTGPGGAAEVRVGRIREAALNAATDLVEDELAVGLETIHLGTIMLLGLCCRHLGPGDSARAYPSWEDWWEDEIVDDPAPGKVTKSTPLAMCQDPSPVPLSLEAAGGVRLVPINDEYVRLEGYRWATNWDRGRSSVFCIDSFGSRGEAVLVPKFCQITVPDSEVYLEVGGMLSSASWLCPGLAELSAKANPRKLALPELIAAIKETPGITLVVPAGKVVFKDPPSSAEFARKAARRHPLYVNAVEMGARLLLSMVPPLKIETTTDAEILQKELGAQIFPIAGHRARLCVRRQGGPPLDAARIAGSTLDDVCRYVGAAWVNTLAAAPSTWTRLNTLVERGIDLEVALGPAGQAGLPADYVPGSGTFMPLRPRLYSVKCPPAVPMCQVCKLHEAVGMEALRHGVDLTVHVCAECVAFVPGSPAYRKKEALAQHTARPVEAILGAGDAGLDHVLQRTEQRTEVRRIDNEDGRQKDSIAYKVGLVPKDACVLAVGAMLSLKAPATGWGDQAELQPVLYTELQDMLGCQDEVLRILSISPEADTSNLMVNVMFMHPAMFKAGRSEPQQSMPLPESEDCLSPLTPLNLYLKLASMLEERCKMINRWAAQKHAMIFPSSLERVTLPCSLFLLRSQVGRPPLVFGNDLVPSGQVPNDAKNLSANSVVVDEQKNAAVGALKHFVENLTQDYKSHDADEKSNSMLAAATVSGEDVQDVQDVQGIAATCSMHELDADKPQPIDALQRQDSLTDARSPKSHDTDLEGAHTSQPETTQLEGSHMQIDDGEVLTVAEQNRTEQDADVALGKDGYQADERMSLEVLGNQGSTSHLDNATADGRSGVEDLAKEGSTSQLGNATEFPEIEVNEVDAGSEVIDAKHVIETGSEAGGVENTRADIPFTEGGGSAFTESAEGASAGEQVHASQDLGTVMDGIEALGFLGLEGPGKSKWHRQPTPTSSSACMDSDSVILHFQSFESDLPAQISQLSVSRNEIDDAHGEKGKRLPSKEMVSLDELGQEAANLVSSEEFWAAATLLEEEEPQEFQGTPSDNPVVNAILIFRPSPKQLALRVRELVAANGLESEEKARSVDNLLTRWGQTLATGGVSLAALAAASRDPSSMRGQSSLDVSIRDANHHVTHVLLNHIPRCDHMVTLLNERNPVTEHTPLYAAVLYPSRHTLSLVRKLVDRKADVNLPGSSLQGLVVETALVNCVRRAERQVIELMLEFRAEVNGVACDGKTMLQVAVERSDEDILQTMLRAPGCQVNAVDSHGRTALITALRGGKYAQPLVCQLLDAHADPAKADLEGTLPIIYASSILRDPSTCKQLLACRADPNSAEVSKDAKVIHLAARARNENLLSALLAARADPNVKEMQGRTALHLALGLGLSLQILRELLESMADPGAHTGATAGGETPLRLAVMAGWSPPKPAGRCPGLRPGEAHQRAPPAISSSAAKEWDVSEAAELLLEARADPNASNLAGCTALHAACSAGNLVVAQLLVSSGADPTLTDKRRWAPIHFCASESQDVVRWLLSLHVDATARTYHGETARLIQTTRSEPSSEITRYGQNSFQGASPSTSLGGTLLNAMSKTEGFKRRTPRGGLQSLRRPRGVFGRMLAAPSAASEKEMLQSMGTGTSGTSASDQHVILPAIPLR